MKSTVGGRKTGNYPEAEGTYSAELSFNPPLVPPSEREQLVTSTGNRVVATPYDAVFEKGVELGVKKPSTGTLIDSRTFGGGAWNEEIELQHSIYPPDSLFQGASSSAPSWRDDLANQATTQAMAKARRGMVALPMLLKELPDSLSMIGNRGKQALNAGTTFQNTWAKRYNLARTSRQRKRIMANAAGAYLEFLFGWTPFIEETYALMKATQKGTRTRVVGRSQIRDTKTIALNTAIIPQSNMTGESIINGNWARWYAYLSGQHVRMGKYEEEWRYRSSITWDFDAKWSGDASKYGANPVDALFDAFPLSFLFNFSTNVQDYLVANSPVIGGTFVTGHVSMLAEGKTTFDVRSNLQATSHLSGKKINLTPGEVKLTASTVRMTRVPYYQEPDPTFVLRSIMDIGRVGTMSALGVVAAEARFRRSMSKFQLKLPPFRYKGPRPRNLPPINFR